MRFLRRLLAFQNDIVGGFFPQPVKPGAVAGQRARLRDYAREKQKGLTGAAGV
jgi:hypothetical protein